MTAVFVALGAFIAIIVVAIFVYEAPARKKNKLSGRGGDFES
jgi:hypothetical protein